MNLGLQLALGGFRKRSWSGVVGKGELVAQPADYRGVANTEAYCNGLEMVGAVLVETVDMLPKQVVIKIVPGNINHSGARKFSTKPLYDFTDFDIRIKVAYRNGDPIPDWFGIINPVTEEAHNLLTDGTEGTLHAMIPVAGDYDVNIEVLAPSGEAGIVRKATYKIELNTIVENTYPTTFVDTSVGVAGDGGDPWGVSLTTATYTDSTQIVEQTGAFTAVDTDAATSDVCPTYHYNYIKLTGASEGGFPAGLYRFTKLNDNQIQLEEALGADYTNVTSSSGPLDAVPFSNFNGQRVFFSGAYQKSTNYAMSYDGSYLIGYKDGCTLTSDDLANAVINYGYGGGGSPAPVNHPNFIGNVVVDGERDKPCVGKNMSSTGSGTFRNLLHRVEFVNSKDQGASVDMLTSGSGEWTRTLTMLQCKFQQLISDRFEHTSAGNLAGTINFQVSATIDLSTPATGYLWYLDATGRIYSAGDTVRHRIPYLSWSGDTFVLDSATTRDCPAGAYVVTGGPELYSYQVVHDIRNRDSDFGVVACDFESDVADDTKDHHLYPTGYLDNLLITLNNFGKGMGVSYAVNGNLKSRVENLTHYNIAYTNNKLSQYMRFGFDCSITNTYSYEVEEARGLLIADNYSNVMHCLYYGADAKTIRFARNSDIDTAGLHNVYTNWATCVMATSALTDSADFHLTMDGNTNRGRQFIRADDGQTQFEIVDNDAQIDFDGVNMRISSSAYADGVIDRNNLYAPNNTAGDIALIDNVGYNITEFNTEVGGVNTSEASGPTLTEVFVGDFVAPNLTDVADLAGWSDLETISSIALEINSNQAYNRGDNNNRSNFATALLGNDHYAQATVVTTGSDSRMYVATRVDPAGVGYQVSQFYGMLFRINTSAGTATVQAILIDGATETPLGTVSNLTGLTGTNTIQMRATGTTLEMYVNGSLVNTVSDSTYSTGNAGIRIFQSPGSTGRITAFSCGNIT